MRFGENKGGQSCLELRGPFSRRGHNGKKREEKSSSLKREMTCQSRSREKKKVYDVRGGEKPSSRDAEKHAFGRRKEKRSCFVSRKGGARSLSKKIKGRGIFRTEIRKSSHQPERRLGREKRLYSTHEGEKERALLAVRKKGRRSSRQETNFGVNTDVL